ncbi:MAG: hypothetical protein R3C53_18935 [Pirellulaceae bacterium]
MASLQREPTQVFHVVFRYDRTRFKRSLETKTESIALARLEEIEETIKLLRDGRIRVPENIASGAFILAGGRLERVKQKSTRPKAEPAIHGEISLAQLFQNFFDALPPDNLEANTLKTMHTHERHFVRLFKCSFPIKRLTGHDLQHYVNTRAKEVTQYNKSIPSEKKSGKRKVSATTIKKGNCYSWHSMEMGSHRAFARRELSQSWLALSQGG